MMDRQLDTLNKAYLLGDYDLKRYRELREELIDEFTDYKPNQNPVAKLNDLTSDPTLQLNEPTLQLNEAKPPNIEHSSIGGIKTEKHHRGPSFLQFLWVSIAVLLFIYMYTASI